MCKIRFAWSIIPESTIRSRQHRLQTANYSWFQLSSYFGPGTSSCVFHSIFFFLTYLRNKLDMSDEWLYEKVISHRLLEVQRVHLQVINPHWWSDQTSLNYFRTIQHLFRGMDFVINGLSKLFKLRIVSICNIGNFRVYHHFNWKSITLDNVIACYITLTTLKITNIACFKIKSLPN